MKRLLDIFFPLAVALAVLGLWEWIVAAKQIPPYILPAPSAIFAALIANWSSLAAAMLATVTVTLEGFCGAAIAAILLAILLSSTASLAAIGRDAFEGKWTVTLTPEEGGKDLKDSLLFKNEKFTSELGKKDGFEESPYEVDVRGGQISTFTANVKGKGGKGLMKWTGTATPDNIQGNLSWTKADGSTKTYTFTGTKAGR